MTDVLVRPAHPRVGGVVSLYYGGDSFCVLPAKPIPAAKRKRDEERAAYNKELLERLAKLTGKP